jgi:hypothetical protein
VTAPVNEFSCTAWLLSFTFHRNWKPGFCKLSLEIFASIFTQEERCASAPPVVQPPPRPNWACATPIQTNTQPNEMVNLRIL